MFLNSSWGFLYVLLQTFIIRIVLFPLCIYAQFSMDFHTRFSALLILMNACSESPRFYKGLENPLSEKRIIWVNWPYSDGERRYPIIPPIGPFIFCLRSRKKVACEQTKSLRATIFSCGLIIETAQDLTRSPHVHFLSFSCPSACSLISVTEHLISHTGQTKKGCEAFPFHRKS